MSTEGFVALLLLLFCAGTSLALSMSPARRRRVGYPKGSVYRRYLVAGWTATLAAAGLSLWLWCFEPVSGDADSVWLAPAPGVGMLLPLVFLFAGAALALLHVLQLLLCRALVLPAHGHRRSAAPAGDGEGDHSPLPLLSLTVAVWLPALLGYEAMRDTWASFGSDGVRRDALFAVDPVERPWAQVATLEYRPWRGGHKNRRLHHAMALVFTDGETWSFHDDGFWGLDDRAVRDRLREIAARHGVAYRHVELR